MAWSNQWSRVRSKAVQVARGAAVAVVLLCVAAGIARADAQHDALARARHDLAVSEQVLARLTERVEVARASAATRPEERARLDEYLVRVRALVAENRERVRHLEERVAGQSRSNTGGSGAPIAAATEAEQVAMLDAKLNNSLEAFDQLLLDEARKARAREAEASADAGNGGSGVRSGKGGKGAAGSRNAGSAGGDSTAAKRGADKDSGAEARSDGGPRGTTSDGSPGGPVGGSERGASGTETAGAPPADVGDGNDDDIVARQIRKAAEAERDPELRKKLWDEYRKYKQGTSG